MKQPKTIKELRNFLLKFPGKTEVHMRVTPQTKNDVYAIAFEVKGRAEEDGKERAKSAGND